jgi:hypothetical protein
MFPDLGSSQQQAAVLVGFFLPLVLAIPIQSHWPDQLRTLFSVAAYAAAGAITAAVAGQLTGKTFWQSTLEIVVLGIVGYQGIWKPSGIAPAIEKHTNVFSDSAEAPAKQGLEPQVASLFGAIERLLDQATHRMASAGASGAAADLAQEHARDAAPQPVDEGQPVDVDSRAPEAPLVEELPDDVHDAGVPAEPEAQPAVAKSATPNGAKAPVNWVSPGSR